MSKFRKGYIQGIKDLILILIFFSSYTYIFIKALEITLK